MNESILEWLVPILFFVFLGSVFLATVKQSRSGTTEFREGSFLDNWPSWFFTARIGLPFLVVVYSLVREC
jgi:hypothetical protein